MFNARRRCVCVCVCARACVCSDAHDAEYSALTSSHCMSEFALHGAEIGEVGAAHVPIYIFPYAGSDM